MRENSASFPEGRELTLRIITPRGVAYETGCDSVTLPLADGGRIGIRRGHMPAELALAQGIVRAASRGVPLGGVSIDGGFASVRADIVTVITDGARPDKD